jgi:hypothetical protein
MSANPLRWVPNWGVHELDGMRCLTLWQPWAWCLFHGKDVENRPWRTPSTVGPQTRVAIHASVNLARYDADAIEIKRTTGVVVPPAAEIEVGSVVGVVLFSGWVRDSASRWAQPGKFHWLVSHAAELQMPVGHRGKQGIFRLKFGLQTPRPGGIFSAQ